MPILHIQLGAQAKTPEGKTVQLHPAIALNQRGPIIQVTVTIEQNAGKGLLAQGKTLPTPKSGVALIDTGATATCIDEQAAQELGLPVIDVAKMTSATHADQQCNVYPVQIAIPPVLILNSPRTIGAALAPQGILVLLGRDLLRNCSLFYNGPAGQFTLSL
ncbi:MAG: retroviral-like aspartic protease family protein [Candidatus Acidiferrales bacterium]